MAQPDHQLIAQAPQVLAGRAGLIPIPPTIQDVNDRLDLVQQILLQINEELVLIKG
jgi:hypothetical protein